VDASLVSRQLHEAAMADFDVIVVGAGPGGSNAAAVALRAGLRVAQIEAARFPRVKPCAGGVTVKAANALQLSLDRSVLRGFHGIEFNLWRQRTNRFDHRDRLLHMVSRPEFDHDLVRQNLRSSSFTFIDGCRVRDATYDGRFAVRTDRGQFTSMQLIAADGAQSLVNRIFRVSSPRAVATAIELNLPMPDASARFDAPCLDYGAVERGYGWVFPKGDHCCVGLYTLTARIRGIRDRLIDYLRSKGIDVPSASLADLHSARLPLGGFRLRVPPCPVYVVGDAGGFADALTGEGIYAALESGRLAGETAADVACGRATHRAYYRRLWGTVLCDTAATYLAAGPFYRRVDRGIRLLQQPVVWRALVQGEASGATVSGCCAMSPWYVPRSIGVSRRRSVRL
jgi:geranylgeranyl reductase family protein